MPTVAIIPNKPWRWWPFRFMLPSHVNVTGISRSGRMLEPMPLKLEVLYQINLQNILLTSKCDKFFVTLCYTNRLGQGVEIKKGVKK